jgi:hypothetical protein
MDIINRLDFFKHNVSKTGSVSIIREKRERNVPIQLVPLERVSLDHWSSFKGRKRAGIFPLTFLPGDENIYSFRRNKGD